MIFVDISNKELLEQHLGEYATWMPYGFGGKGMLGLYPTNEHSEDEIIEQLKKHNIPYYTEVTEAIVLTESGNDEADESYKGIFIDRKTGDFKILTGRFPDKKAMINKYGTLGKDYIARKVFEKPVFDWILNNAKSSLDSYLMFSTAFSKWRHNSILDKYYMKLINDMPQLFKNVRAQDRIGGDNKAKHADKESVELDEVDHSTHDDGGKKVWFVVYGPNGVLEDLTDEGGIPVSFGQYDHDFESVELYDWMQKAVDEVRDETGEEPTGVGVKTSKRDNQPKIYTRQQIEDGFTRNVGRVQNEDNYFAKLMDNPQDQEHLKVHIYCKDPQGKKIIPRPYPVFVDHLIEKGNGIDDFQVWITALQVLNTVYGEPEQNTKKLNVYTPEYADQQVFIDYNGQEYWANRGEIYKNVHNMEPGQTKIWTSQKGNPYHPNWKVHHEKKFDSDKALANYLNAGRQSVIMNTVDTSKLPKIDKSFQIGHIRTGNEDQPIDVQKHKDWDVDINSIRNNDYDADEQNYIKPTSPEEELRRYKDKVNRAWTLDWINKNANKEDKDLLIRMANDAASSIPSVWVTKGDSVTMPYWDAYWKDYQQFKKAMDNGEIDPEEIIGESKKEQTEHDMFLREEVRKLIEASGIYDLPDYSVDLADDNVNNVVRFIVKNTFGKDDVEEVLINKPISADVELEDFALPEIEAAARKIKDRNPGKKVYVQVNDEEPTEYIDIEEPQA